MFLNIKYKKGNVTIFVSKRNKYPDHSDHEQKYIKTRSEETHKILYSNIGMPNVFISLYGKVDSQVKIWVKYSRVIKKNEFVFQKPNNMLEKILHNLVTDTELQEVEGIFPHTFKSPFLQ